MGIDPVLFSFGAADTSGFEQKLRELAQHTDDLNAKTEGFASGWDRGAHQFGRSALQMLAGLDDLGKSGVDVTAVIGRMSLEFGGLAEGIGRAVGADMAMVAGLAGFVAAAPAVAQILTDLVADWTGLAEAADAAHARIAQSAEASKREAEEHERARGVLHDLVEQYESWDQAQTAMLANTRERIARSGQEFSSWEDAQRALLGGDNDLLMRSYGNVETIRAAWGRMVQSAKQGEEILGGTMVVTGDVIEGLERKAKAAEDAMRRASQAAAALYAEHTKGLFRPEPGLMDRLEESHREAESRRRFAAPSEEDKQADLEVLMSTNAAVGHNIELMGQKAIADDNAARAAVRQHAALLLQRQAFIQTAQSATYAAVATAALVAAQTGSARAAIDAVRAQAMVETIKEFALGLAASAWAIVDPTGTGGTVAALHFESAAAWAAIGGIASVAGAIAGGSGAGKTVSPSSAPSPTGRDQGLGIGGGTSTGTSTGENVQMVFNFQVTPGTNPDDYEAAVYRALQRHAREQGRTLTFGP